VSRLLVQAEWKDAPHLTEKQRADLYAAIPPYQRQARTRGIPQLGSGVIYPIDEAEIVCEPFRIPDWYRHAYGMDVGWNRTAVVWGALDPETDILYLYSEHYRGQSEPPVHAQAVHARGRWIPGAIDPAARGRGQADGERLMQQYVDLGLQLTKADNSVEAGLYEVLMRLTSGRLRIFSAMVPSWLSEFRVYRRDEKGHIVKVNDHAMDATRYLCISGVHRAISRPPEAWITPIPGKGRVQHKSDYDPYAKAWSAG
jgi:hypothetical protein